MCDSTNISAVKNGTCMNMCTQGIYTLRQYLNSDFRDHLCMFGAVLRNLTGAELSIARN